MSINSSDFLESAKRCFALSTEVDFRNSVSRSYYAMYHEARTSLTCLPSYSGSQHSNLIGYLASKAENKLEPYDAYKMKLLGYQLNQQRKARHEADYDLQSIDVTDTIAEVAIKSAEDFLNEWKTLKKSKVV